MKELASVAARICPARPAAPGSAAASPARVPSTAATALEGEEEAGLRVEVILVCTEPAWRFEGRELVKGRQAADVRFRASPEQIERLAESLRGFAAEGRRLAAKAAAASAGAAKGKEAA